MSTITRSESRRSRSGWALAALGLGAFVIGTAELVIVGVLDLIADDLSVSISSAGQLVTAYALGISIGGPVATALTIRLGRRFLLWLSLAVYIVGNILAAAAVGFEMILIARILTGAIHGLFIGVAFMVGAALVPPDRQGRAVSMVFGGISVSTVVGVPLGTFIGQVMGWRATFVTVVILGVVALIATLVLIPQVAAEGRSEVGSQMRAAFAPRVLAVLGVGFLLLGGQFTALTYMSPYLADVTGISGELTSVFLLAFGIATAVGTFAGGRAADRAAGLTLIVTNALLVLALGALYLVGSSPILAALALAGWGLVGFGLVPSLQLRVITLAGKDSDLAATLGASAVNAGIAVGAVAGGWIAAQYDIESVVVAAMVICLIAFPATWATRMLKAPSDVPPAPAASGAFPCRGGSDVVTNRQPVGATAGGASAS